MANPETTTNVLRLRHGAVASCASFALAIAACGSGSISEAEAPARSVEIASEHTDAYDTLARLQDEGSAIFVAGNINPEDYEYQYPFTRDYYDENADAAMEEALSGVGGIQSNDIRIIRLPRGLQSAFADDGLPRGEVEQRIGLGVYGGLMGPDLEMEETAPGAVIIDQDTIDPAVLDQLLQDLGVE